MDAESILNNLLESVIKNEGINDPEIVIKPVSSGGANYTSKLYTITIKSNEKVELELFAKVASLGDKMRKEMKGDNIYSTERFVYKDLANIYEKLQTRDNILEEDKFKFPKFYACNDKYSEETVILENLTAKGYICHDRLKPVTWAYAEAAVGAMAKFHALSYAFSEDDPDGFAKVAAERKMMMDGTEQESTDMFTKASANIFPLIPEEMSKRLLEYTSNFQMDSYKNFLNSTKRPVLVHGDYRPSNLMHAEKNGKVDLIPVDYQTMYAGPPLVDLLYFILSATDGEFRKHHLERLIDHYYDTCATFLKKLDLDPDRIYPRKQFDKDYNEYLPFGILSSMIMLPLILVESENAPATDGDAGMTDFVVEPNEVFKQRYIELIEDYIRWGIL